MPIVAQDEVGCGGGGGSNKQVCWDGRVDAEFDSPKGQAETYRDSPTQCPTTVFALEYAHPSSKCFAINLKKLTYLGSEYFPSNYLRQYSNCPQ